MNTEFRGMSTFFRGITKTVPSLFRGIFSERNFDGNPSKYERGKPGARKNEREKLRSGERKGKSARDFRSGTQKRKRED
jgi:hypothetical protein